MSKENNNDKKWSAPSYTKYEDDIAEHMNKLSPNSNTIVFHEMVSNLIHIDVHFIKQSEEDGNFNILYTTGMSAMPMTFPKGTKEETKRDLEYAELMMFIPKDWDLGKEFDITTDMPYERRWPIDLLKFLTKYPHEYKTYFTTCHTIPNGAEYEHFAENTNLSSVILVPLKDNISRIKTKDGSIINMYNVLPLYKEECELKLEKGAWYVLDKIIKEYPKNPWLLNIERKNVAL